MSGSGGVVYYDEKLKYLLQLLKGLPQAIPIGDHHNFLGYVLDPEKVLETGCQKLVITALNAAYSDNTEGGDTITSFSATVLDTLCDGVDITLPFFRDLLADKPIEGANANWSLADWSKGGEVNRERGKNALHHMVWDGEAEKVVF
ncbi:hypothetical protein B0H10DRAFT_1939024 [Mycena sp. CBHHK59/15]|nr:hypothetical protein B0H10DRAFT_1939024 [Mycena sp. CBHHK59/15]